MRLVYPVAGLCRPTRKARAIEVEGDNKQRYTVIMVRTQVSLDIGMYKRAREEAKRQGISFAEICRRALALWLDTSRGDQPWMQFAGSVEGGDPESSQSVDQVVYGRERP